MTSILQILLFVIDILWFLVLAQVILSWLVNFDVLNLRQPFVYQIWSGLNRILEPLYAPIRKVLPPMGGIDLAPLVLIVALYAVQRILVNNLAGMAF
ncbi:YggT family protein [Halovulum dunhuangense]|uniref:YggT family protein n=1 Tax=Halovulum dunhuangense TaxID=1505036 RepID=A0A849L642_9RHOB|nr:YggT family protein [Halovulum dunhuangense]NNU81581.1 YggT family protein [Halovulum dunhuangense]